MRVTAGEKTCHQGQTSATRSVRQPGAGRGVVALLGVGESQARVGGSDPSGTVLLTPTSSASLPTVTAQCVDGTRYPPFGTVAGLPLLCQEVAPEWVLWTRHVQFCCSVVANRLPIASCAGAGKRAAGRATSGRPVPAGRRTGWMNGIRI